MKIRRLGLAPAVMLVSLALMGPVEAVSPQPSDGGWHKAESALAAIATARDAMGSGRLGGVLRAAGIPSPSPVDLAPSVLAEADVPAPIALLDAVVRQARGRIESALPANVEDRSFRALTLRAMAGKPIAPMRLDPSVGSVIRDAAGSVAAAIDVLLPQIAALATRGAVGSRVEGCDLHDAAPDLCVASDADNILSTDYALVVDLGGDDTHTHSAGGAILSENGLAVSVTIDVEGNDIYDAPVPTASGSYMSQGAAFLGAGFLVDAAGNDQYRIAPTEPFGFAVGQGKGLHGVGVLADLQGADSYEISATGPGPQLAMGQGDVDDGAGVLLDLGGNDVHTIEAVSTDFFDGAIGGSFYQAPPVAEASGIGAANSRIRMFPVWVFGPNHVDVITNSPAGQYGLFLDGGGSDTLEVHSEILDPNKDAYLGRPWMKGAAASSVGIGYADERSLGLVVLGEGDTDASVTSSSHSPRAETSSLGLGYGSFYAAGAVSDRGGNDTWRLSSENVVERRGGLSAGCSCPPPATAATLDTTVIGLGYGESFGVGLVEDASGNDRYLASATNSVETELVEHAGDPQSKVRASSTTGAVRVAVEGAADAQGVGMLQDATGNDVYEIAAASAARSQLSGVLSGSGKGVSIAGNTSVLGQAAARGFGSGTLRDTGGNDVYRTSSTSLAQAQPATDVQPGTPLAGVLSSVDQGSSAAFLDSDGGLVDTFSATPATPACTGTRGQAQWVDCGGAGFGAMV